MEDLIKDLEAAYDLLSEVIDGDADLIPLESVRDSMDTIARTIQLLKVQINEDPYNDEYISLN